MIEIIEIIGNIIVGTVINCSVCKYFIDEYTAMVQERGE